MEFSVTRKGKKSRVLGTAQNLWNSLPLGRTMSRSGASLCVGLWNSTIQGKMKRKREVEPGKIPVSQSVELPDTREKRRRK